MSNRNLGGAIGAAWMICSFLAAVLIIGGILSGSGSDLILGIVLGIPALIILYIANKRNKSESIPDKKISESKDGYKSSIEIIKIRLAKGEITQEEFDGLRKKLQT